MLVGRKDAWALMGIGTGVAISSPWLAGSPYILPALVAPAAGAGWFAYKRALSWMDRTDTESRENFVLPSDETYGDLMSTQKGIRFGYTRDNGMPVDISNTFLSRHTAIIGQSGVGKTTLGEYLLWQQVIRGGGFLFIDAKLDAATRDKLNMMLELCGRADEFYVLNVDEPHNSNTYNPILQGDADEVASRLLNLLPSAENSPGADFFRQQANYALTVLTGAMKSANRRYDFSDLSILLQSDQALEKLLQLPLSAEAEMTLKVFLNQFRKKDKNGISIDIAKVKEVLGGISGRIALFSQGKFGQVFNTYTPEIDLTDIVMNNKCLYVMLPTMGKDTAALNLGKIILSDLRTAVYNVQGLPAHERPNPPFICFCDEMGSYVMSGIARLFEQARSAGICMIPAFQTFANLRTVGPDFEDIIIGNTWNKVCFKFASKDSPETAAEIIGKTKKFAKSLSMSVNEGESSANIRTTPQGNASDGAGMSESWRESEEYRVSPEHLKSLGLGEAILLSGSRVFHINTPMMEFPSEISPFKVNRHRVFLPPNELGMNLKDQYEQFLMKSDEREPKSNDRGGVPLASESLSSPNDSNPINRM